VGDQVDQTGRQGATQGFDVWGLGGIGKGVWGKGGEFPNSADKGISVQSQFPSGLGPCVPEWEDLVIAADLHGEPQHPFVYVIWKRRGDVVQWCQADLVIGEEQGVVLGVSVGSRDDPVPDQGIGKPPDGVVSSPRRHRTAKQLADVGGSWASLILVLERRRECERLAQILLMDPDDLTPHLPPVVTVDDDGGLVPEPADLRPGSNQPGTSGGVEAEVLVQVVVVKPGDRRLEDVGGRGGAGWNTPTPILEEQSRLRLGSGEAELAGEGPAEPGRGVFAKVPQALSYLVLGEPGNPPRGVPERGRSLPAGRSGPPLRSPPRSGLPGARTARTTKRGTGEPREPERRRCPGGAPIATK